MSNPEIEEKTTTTPISKPPPIVRSNSVIDSIKLGAFKGISVPASYLRAIPNYLHKNLRSKKYPNGQSVILKHDENELRIRRRGFEDKLLVDFDGFTTITAIFRDCVKKFTHKHFHGSRILINKEIIPTIDPTKSITKLTLGGFQWESYGEIWTKVQCYCAFLRHINVDSTKKVAIWADTCSDWMCICLAFMYLKIHTVTVYSTLIDEAILFAINLTEVDAIVVDVKSYLRLFQLIPKLPSIEKIFLFGPFDESDLDKFPDNIKKPHLYDVRRKQKLAPKLPRNVLRSQRIQKNLKNVPMFYSIDCDGIDEPSHCEAVVGDDKIINSIDGDDDETHDKINKVIESPDLEQMDHKSIDETTTTTTTTTADATTTTTTNENIVEQTNDIDEINNIENAEDNNKVKCYHISQMLIDGRRYLKDNPLEFEQVDKEDIAIIMFTSGSSGIPKGVNIQHKSLVAAVAAASYNRVSWIDSIYPAYLPLAHIFEFIAEMSVVANGGAVGYCTPLTLTDTSPMIAPGTKGDLAELKPTVGTFVPLLLERIKKSVIEKVHQRGAFASSVLDYSVNHTKKMRTVGLGAPIVEKLAFSKIRNIIGGHFRWAVCGGAPLSPLTHEFANISFGFPIIQGYGLTETCAGGTFADHEDFSIDNTGPPFHCAEIRLIPWVEGAYSPNDQPNPRGEIVVAGECVAMGYYKNEQATNDSFFVDPETNIRCFKTGDIGEYCPNGTIKIIDRKKDIIKLKHGEYVSLVLVETIAQGSQYIELCTALPNHDHDYVVLLVMPNRVTLQSNLQQLNPELNSDTPVEDIINDEKVRAFICDDILANFAGTRNSKFESPAKVILVTDIWTPESGLLTPSMKIKRTEMKNFYSNLLNS